jgi:hypothetical protein
VNFDRAENQEQIPEDHLKLVELFRTPDWQTYLDTVENEIFMLFRAIFQLDPSRPDNFIKFVEYKSRIDALINITYNYEMELAKGNMERAESVNSRYTSGFKNLLNRLFKRGRRAV